MDAATCDSCGGDGGEDLVALHRLYVVPESWDQDSSVTRLDEVERWCSACRAHYPHELIVAAPPDGEGRALL